MLRRRLTGECRRLAETSRVLARVHDNEFGARRDLIDAVEEDDVVQLAGPEVRSSTARRRHLHRVHPVRTAGVATVHAMRRTSVAVEYLYTNQSGDSRLRPRYPS